MSASWQRAFCLMMVSASLVAGCSSAKKIDVGGTCVLNSDCNGSLVCTAGKCHDACHTSADCPAGQSCVKTSDSIICQLPAETSCSATSPCGSGLSCAPDQHCRTTCLSVANCTTGQVCASNFCADPNDPNITNGQLPPTPGLDAGTCDGASPDLQVVSPTDSPPAAPQALRSCQAYLNAGQNSGDGLYRIDPDGAGPVASFAVYCDMTQHHGGWILVGKLGGSVPPASKGPLTVDRNIQQMTSGVVPDATEFSAWDLSRFDAWGRTWTVRISTDVNNDGSHFQYTFFRPADAQSALPSAAGGNWLGNTINTQLVHLTMSTTTGLSNTTWLTVPSWDLFSNEQFMALGYRVGAAVSDTALQCLTSDGQTQLCHVVAGPLLVRTSVAVNGTVNAAYGYDDGVSYQESRRATYWIKDVNASGTP